MRSKPRQIEGSSRTPQGGHTDTPSGMEGFTENVQEGERLPQLKTRAGSRRREELMNCMTEHGEWSTSTVQEVCRTRVLRILSATSKMWTLLRGPQEALFWIYEGMCNDAAAGETVWCFPQSVQHTMTLRPNSPSPGYLPQRAGHRSSSQGVLTNAHGSQYVEQPRMLPSHPYPSVHRRING